MKNIKKPIYDKNVIVVKKYSDDKYKMTLHKTLRRKGFEIDDVEKSERGTVNEVKLLNSIARSRSKVQEYAICNDWQYFVTLTLDKNKYDRYDLKKYIKDFGQFIGNYNRNRDEKIKYVIIPEKHIDGAWHLHGIFMGFENSDLNCFTKNDFPSGKIPLYILDKLDNNQPIYYFKSYSKKFGFNVFDPIRDKDKVASYVLKYFSKNLSRSITDLNSNLYYPSHGLKKSIENLRGFGNSFDFEFDYDYEGEYISVKWLSQEQYKFLLKWGYVRHFNFNKLLLNLQYKYNRSMIKRLKIIKSEIKHRKEISLMNDNYYNYLLGGG